MTTYHTNEGSFELPEVGFADRTVHLFEVPLDEGGELAFIVCRTPMPEGKSLREVVLAHVAHEAKQLGGFKILAEEERTWAGVPALEVASRWRSEGAVVYQRQAHLAANGLWILFGLNAPLEARAAGDAILDHVLSSFRLHDGP